MGIPICYVLYDQSMNHYLYHFLLYVYTGCTFSQIICFSTENDKRLLYFQLVLRMIQDLTKLALKYLKMDVQILPPVICVFYIK